MLVDCDKEMDGCDGGEQNSAFKYMERDAVELESTYPYKAKDGRCKYKAANGKVKVVRFAKVKKNDADQLRAAIALGPTSVSVEADKNAF